MGRGDQNIFLLELRNFQILFGFKMSVKTFWLMFDIKKNKRFESQNSFRAKVIVVKTIP